MTKPQLATGPQKWVVLGPTGLFRNDLSAVAMGEEEAAEITCPCHAYRITTSNPITITAKSGCGDLDRTYDQP